MASSLITSWQKDGETMEIVIYFIFLGYKITVDGLVKRDTEETHKEGLLLRFLPLVIHNYVNLLYT